MKYLFLPNLLMFLVLFSCQQQKEPTIAALTQEITALNRGMEQAYNEGKLQEVANFYADDAYLLGPGGYQERGRKAIDDYWLRFKSPIRWKLEVVVVSKTEAGLYESDYWKNLENKPPHWNNTGAVFTEQDEVLYQLGHSQLEYEREDATHQISHVDFIIVWKKQESGVYKIFVDTYHGNGPMKN